MKHLLSSVSLLAENPSQSPHTLNLIANGIRKQEASDFLD
jgi:hypothetical protein